MAHPLGSTLASPASSAACALHHGLQPGAPPPSTLAWPRPWASRRRAYRRPPPGQRWMPCATSSAGSASPLGPLASRRSVRRHHHKSLPSGSLSAASLAAEDVRRILGPYIAYAVTHATANETRAPIAPEIRSLYHRRRIDGRHAQAGQSTGGHHRSRGLTCSPVVAPCW